MSKRFTIYQVALSAAVSFLVGVIIAGEFTHPRSSRRRRDPWHRAVNPSPRRVVSGRRL
jgi:hypothetical protein